MNFWNYIVETNTFNFIIFAIIIAYIVKLINVPKILSDMQKKVADSVENSKDLKEKSKENLISATKEKENTSNEIQGIFEQTNKTAEDIAIQIKAQANSQVEVIENNTKKILENNEKITRKNLSKTATTASLQLATNDIIDNLKINPNLHQQFIDEGIEKLETMEI